MAFSRVYLNAHWLSDVAGGVLLGLRDEAELARAVDELAGRLAPPAFSVERMAPLDEGVELLVGARWDRRFGPISIRWTSCNRFIARC